MSDPAPTRPNFRYIYDLPYEIHRKLGLLLDLNDQWKDLGGIYMKFNILDLDRIGKAVYRKESPTEELLKQWGNQNHTILELFYILYKMKQCQAMKILKPFVEEQYHYILDEGVSRMVIDTSDRLRTLLEINAGTNPHTAPDQSIRGPADNSPLNNQIGPNNTERSSGAFDISELGCGLPLIDYQQLKEGTNNWHRSNFLGRGGFGVVFKGVIKQTPMAIKRLEPQKGNELEFNALEAQRQQLFRELKYLNNNRHDNILPLYGFSFGENKCCLVYQFMANGSLDDRIQCRLGTYPLPWNIRYSIARGTARGIQFLHSSRDKPLVHGDIKSANILLDQYMEPKIGDFGLAREGPTANYTYVQVSRVHGTRPYLPDEFLRGKKFSTKVDTYSFGVVLFEIATGLRAHDEARADKFLRDHICNYKEEKLHEVIDPRIGSENFPLFKTLIELGKKCVVTRPKARPEMIDVSKEIDKTWGDIDSFIRASQARLISLRFDPTHRRGSGIPATGSYHPEPWLYATPPGSIPVSIQPPPIPNRQSPSPTNPGATVPGLPEVSEENPNENTSNANVALRVPTIDPVPNSQGVPNIVLTPAVNSDRNANSASQITSSSSSVSNSDGRSVTEESTGQRPVPIADRTYMDNSDNFLPMVSLLQNGN